MYFGSYRKLFLTKHYFIKALYSYGILVAGTENWHIDKYLGI